MLSCHSESSDTNRHRQERDIPQVAVKEIPSCVWTAMPGAGGPVAAPADGLATLVCEARMPGSCLLDAQWGGSSGQLLTEALGPPLPLWILLAPGRSTRTPALSACPPCSGHLQVLPGGWGNLKLISQDQGQHMGTHLKTQTSGGPEVYSATWMNAHCFMSGKGRM